MYLTRTLRIILLSSILILGSLLPALIIAPVVSADPVSGETTFYFKDILGLEEPVEYDSIFGMSVLVSQDPPTKQNDSEYPPNLFDGFKINSEEWLTWFTTSWILYLLNESLLGGDMFEGLELLFPHPFRIVEIYEYDGEESVGIDGSIVFDLCFSSTTASKFNDNDRVDVGLYSMNPESSLPLPKLIKNNTVQLIQEKILGGIHDQEITLENINFTLDPGESLLFSIEIIPSNKTLTNVIKKDRPNLEPILQSVWDKLYNFMINKSENPTLQEIGAFISEISELIEGSEEIDITKDDVAEIFNSMISSSFVYDSVGHPSSVTLPFKPPGNEDENTKIYYLHDGNEMDEEKPTKDSPSPVNLLEQSENWDNPDIERNKILNGATACLYIRHKDYTFLKDKIKVTAVLFYKDNEIASSERELDKTQDLLPPSGKATLFTFSNLDDTEIIHDTHLNFRVYVSNHNNTNLNLDLLRSVELLYDSDEYPSSLTLKFIETDHIKMEVSADPSNEKVVPGGNVKYAINITSDSEDDTVKITTSGFSEEEKEAWAIEISSASVSISKDGTETVNVIVTSDTLADDSAKLEVTFVAIGITGKDTFDAVVEVSEDAVEYDINIITPSSNKTIRHGENDTYHFKIKNKNTGIWSDDYQIEASSEHGWNLSYKKIVKNLYPNNESEIEVTIYVPKNTNVTSDKLTFTVTSENGDISKTVNVTTTIIGPNFLENLYGFFESAAESLGLDGVFGSYAPHFLVAMLFIIAFFIIIIMIFLLTTKFVKITCLERIKEIFPNEVASFEMIIKNHTRKTRSYEITALVNSESPKWTTSLDLKNITLEPGKSKPVVLMVKPTDLVKPDDWAETNIAINVEGKKKSEKMATMTMIKGAKAELSFGSVFHWPKTFKEGDRVTSSFKLENKGNASASNVSVVLYVNNEEKNKVEDIIIPAGGYADIKMPWIAVKGKNEIEIVVR